MEIKNKVISLKWRVNGAYILRIRINVFRFNTHILVR